MSSMLNSYMFCVPVYYGYFHVAASSCSTCAGDIG